MSCDVGEVTERLENKLCSFFNPSFASPTSQTHHLRHLASRPSVFDKNIKKKQSDNRLYVTTPESSYSSHWRETYRVIDHVLDAKYISSSEFQEECFPIKQTCPVSKFWTCRWHQAFLNGKQIHLVWICLHWFHTIVAVNGTLRVSTYVVKTKVVH